VQVTTSGVSYTSQVAWNLTNNYGSITVNNLTYDAVAYYSQVMGDPNPPGIVRWLNLFATSPLQNNIAIVYLGLDPNNYSLMDSFWYEDYTRTLYTDSIAPGYSCTFTNLEHAPRYNTALSFSPLCVDPPSSVSTGITIDGPSISLQDTAGWLVIGALNYSVIPISTVDCSNCGYNCPVGCLPGPWWEIHFFLSNSAGKFASRGFGIYYIYPDSARNFVQLNYTLILPSLTTPNTTYPATWSGSIPGVA
jgi:hypothetical protein